MIIHAHDSQGVVATPECSHRVRDSSHYNTHFSSGNVISFDYRQFVTGIDSLQYYQRRMAYYLE